MNTDSEPSPTGETIAVESTNPPTAAMYFPNGETRTYTDDQEEDNGEDWREQQRENAEFTRFAHLYLELDQVGRAQVNRRIVWSFTKTFLKAPSVARFSLAAGMFKRLVLPEIAPYLAFLLALVLSVVIYAQLLTGSGNPALLALASACIVAAVAIQARKQPQGNE